jgi:predicted AAA+ superfamily ATPase
LLQETGDFTLTLLQIFAKFTLTLCNNIMNTTFNRHLINDLERWKNKPSRKPLVIRGARQVGKTTLIHNFAKNYKHSILLNLERPSDRNYFKNYTDARTIVDALFLANNIPGKEVSETLLFIDEIQESSEAIGLLRYFYEDIPQLHVIAAGSLLEHVMQKVKSYPVGRVEYLYMHPLNFIEFLEANGQKEVINQLNHIPVNNFAHSVLMDLFHQYAIIGGMPEIISTWLSSKKLADLPVVYESIWTTYKEDVEKYAKTPLDARVIRHVIQTAHTYLDQRIKFQNFGNSNYKSREVGEAFRNLNDARVIQLIYPTTDITPPLRPDLRKAPRLQFLDTGLVNYELKIQADMLEVSDLNTSYKGKITPHIITQELLSLSKLNYRTPNFWVREKKQSSAEVDLILPYKDKLIPVEIKSGKAGKLKSLHLFVNSSPHPYAVRMYAGEFRVEKHKTIEGKEYLLMNLPYYLGTRLPEYIEYFVESYKL